MADPMSASARRVASTSHTTKIVSQSPLRRQKRRPRRYSYAHPYAAPSSGLLSILATIAASSSAVDGSPINSQPIPPSFLCPSIDDDGFDPSLNDDESCDSAVLLEATPTSTTYDKRGLLADKYEESPDGRWRRADSWTLYGSTLCTTCQTSSTSVPTVDDEIDSSQPSNTPAQVSSTQDILDTLPSGWKQTDKPSTRSTLILCLSLVLALLICILMVSCIFWRKKKRRLLDKDKDLEMKSKENIQDAEESKQKEAREKQKIWARASARWRASVRSAARRRRGQRISTALKGAPSQRLLTPDQDVPARAHSVNRPSSLSPPSTPSTRTPSRRHSINSIEDLDDDVFRNHLVSRSSPPSILNSRPSSPPAYHRKSITFGDHPLHHEPLGDPFTYPPNLGASTSSSHEKSPDDELRYIASSGHVATDDKALLARMTQLASSPPLDGLPPPDENLLNNEVSAPAWQDEEFEHFETHPEYASGSGLDGSRVWPSHDSSQEHAHSLFPAPSKGKMAVLYHYDYPELFDEEFPSLSPEEPSAPPFEDSGPSAPPIEDAETLPSAPPLMEGDEFEDDSIRVSEDHGGPSDSIVAFNHDRMETSISSSSHRSMTFQPSPAFGEILLHEVVAREGPSLPVYRP